MELGEVLMGASQLAPHRARPVHRKANPVHVTLRAGLRSLRAQQVARTLLGALRGRYHSARFILRRLRLERSPIRLASMRFVGDHPRRGCAGSSQPNSNDVRREPQRSEAPARDWDV
jgi:hypothetical protein